MKISKDQGQKIFLAALLFAAVGYSYFSLLLGPLNRKETAARNRIAQLGPQMEEARKQIKKTQNIEEKAPTFLATLDSINALIPEGAPVAWFPPRMADFFKRQGMDKTATRLTNEFPEKELKGYRRLVWTIDVPKAEFVSLAIAVAGLENEEPLLEINNIQIETVKEDVQFQHALLSVASIVKQ